MTSKQPVTMTIGFVDPELEPEEREKQAQLFRKELKEMDEVESVELVPDPSPPAGHKAVEAAIAGFLSTQFLEFNVVKVFNYLGDRLGGKQIQLEVENNGRKLKVSAHSREELKTALEAAQRFIEGK